MVHKIFNILSKKILWRLARPVSKFLFLCHSISYKDPFGKIPLAKNIAEYDENFKHSVELINHPITKNKTFLKYPPEKKFIENLAYTLQNVLKKTRNSYVHGYILYSYLAEYVNDFYKLNKNKTDILNIVDIGTARGFSSLCLAKALENNNISGKIFTFDILPNRSSFFWNSHTDISQGQLSRIELLKPWRDLVDKYIIFFSTATFNSLNIVDIPKIHFAFIDGSHSFQDVFLEINYLIQRLDNNSILIFDDYDEELFPGVVKACNYLSSLNKHKSFELISIQNRRKLAIFCFN